MKNKRLISLIRESCHWPQPENKTEFFQRLKEQ